MSCRHWHWQCKLRNIILLFLFHDLLARKYLVESENKYRPQLYIHELIDSIETWMQFILEKIELWLLIWCVDLGQLHKYKDQSPSLDIPWTLLLCETFDKSCHHIDHICSILRDEKMQILKLRLSLCYVMCHYFLLLICEIMMLVRVFDPTWSTEECRYDTKQICLENRCKKINILRDELSLGEI